MVRLIEAVKSPEQRLWYARQATELGWSRNVLVHQIEADFYARQGRVLTDFSRTLPAPQSELAQQIVKDPYTLLLELGGVDPPVFGGGHGAAFEAVSAEGAAVEACDGRSRLDDARD